MMFIGKLPRNERALALCRLLEALHILCIDDSKKILPDEKPEEEEIEAEIQKRPA